MISEQADRAEIIRSIVERTLAIAHTWNVLEAVEQSWIYRGEDYTLTYQPDSAQLSVSCNDQSWQLDWHEGLFIPSDRSNITTEHLRSFEMLGQWLETVEYRIPQSRTDLTQTQANTLITQAAQLFEYYASQGDEAFQFSASSTEHFYRVQVESTVYLISQDDATGMYSLQKEDATGLTPTDGQAWEQVSQWVNHLMAQPGWQLDQALPIWEQRVIQVNQLLPHARSLFAMNHSADLVEYDRARQSYVTGFDDYVLGYAPDSDCFWLERQGERLFSALNYQQHEDSFWMLDELDDLGLLSSNDVRRFEEWATWVRLQMVAELTQMHDLDSKSDREFER